MTKIPKHVTKIQMKTESLIIIAYSIIMNLNKNYT